MEVHVQKIESARTLPNQLEPHKHHVSDHLPHVQLEVIRTKFQVIRNCREVLEGLVSIGTKIQLSPICRDYRHI